MDSSGKEKTDGGEDTGAGGTAEALEAHSGRITCMPQST